jgi:hypothetical protein
MSALISVFFFVALAFNTYLAAKRQGTWSWPQFLVTVASLVAIPILIIFSLMHVKWLLERPAAFTLIVSSLILLCVCAFAYALNNWRARKK